MSHPAHIRLDSDPPTGTAYVSGRKIVESRVAELQKELDSLQSARLSYAVVRANTYAQGLTKLRTAYTKARAAFRPTWTGKDGKAIVRPLTFQETIDAKVKAYESGNKRLFNTCLNTCTGIVFDGTSKFKIVQSSEELVLLSRGVDGPCVESSYEKVAALELDRNDSRFKYNNLLGYPEVLNHPAWNEAVPDRALLRAYRDIVFGELNKVQTEEAMGFFLRSAPPADSLWALAIDLLLGCFSVANGVDDLSCEARFVQVVQGKGR